MSQPELPSGAFPTSSPFSAFQVALPTGCEPFRSVALNVLSGMKLGPTFRTSASSGSARQVAATQARLLDIYFSSLPNQGLLALGWKSLCIVQQALKLPDGVMLSSPPERSQGEEELGCR